MKKKSKKQSLLEAIRRNPSGISFGYYFKAATEFGLTMGDANYYLQDYREKGLVILTPDWYDEHTLIKPVISVI